MGAVPIDFDATRVAIYEAGAGQRRCSGGDLPPLVVLSTCLSASAAVGVPPPVSYRTSSID